MTPLTGETGHTGRIVLAYLLLCGVWGSTYLAIRLAVASMPPFFMMGLRALLAGALLFGWAWLRGGERPTAAAWRRASLVGGLLFVGGHGLLAWGEVRVPSGVAALLACTSPVWMAVFQARGERRALGGRTVVGLALGLAGVTLLAGPATFLSGPGVDAAGAAALTLSGLAWAAGSMLSRRDGATTSAPLSAGMNLLSGGALLMLSSAALGEPVSAAAFTMQSMLAVGYLVVAGSTIAFAVYVWLIRVADPTRVSTFAFVNPLVALALGWAFAGESLTPRVAGAAVLMLSGVAAIVMAGRVAAAAGDGVWKRGPRPLAVPSRGGAGTPTTHEERR